MEPAIKFVIILMILLTVGFFYARFFSKRAPMGNFNDVMSHYVWRTKRIRKSIRKNEKKRVKDQESKKTMVMLDSVFADKVNNAKEDIQDKTEKVATKINKSKIIPLKKNLKREVRKIASKITEKLSDGPSKKDKLISQMQEVYRNE